jgi:hypothetical protein
MKKTLSGMKNSLSGMKKSLSGMKNSHCDVRQGNMSSQLLGIRKLLLFLSNRVGIQLSFYLLCKHHAFTRNYLNRTKSQQSLVESCL